MDVGWTGQKLRPDVVGSLVAVEHRLGSIRTCQKDGDPEPRIRVELVPWVDTHNPTRNPVARRWVWAMGIIVTVLNLGATMT